MQIQFEFTGFEQKMHIEGHPFVPIIYEGKGDPPQQFNTMRIALDASEHSDLHWSEAEKIAQHQIDKGLYILWDLHLGLLEGSLEDDSRYMTLELGVQHFLDTLWPMFKNHTIGIALYRGHFDEEVKQMLVEYLKMLAALLPEELPCFIFLDTKLIEDPAAYFHLMSLDAFGYLRLALKGPCTERYPYAIPALAWGHGKSPLGISAQEYALPLPQKRIEYGICLPRGGGDDCIRRVADILKEHPFRVIPESILTHEWDGIEKLIIFPEWLSERGLRKIKGFVAAGGEIINYPNDVALLLPQQTSPLFSYSVLW